MNDKYQIAANIKALRKYYGETQKQLREALGGYEKATFSSYETGARTIDMDTLSKIAAHYFVPVEALINEDLTKINDNLELNPRFILENLDVFFPISHMETEEHSTGFVTAVTLQERIYAALKAGPDVASECIPDDAIDTCLDTYAGLFDNPKVRMESMANFLSLFFLYKTVAESFVSVLRETDKVTDPTIKTYTRLPGITELKQLFESKSAREEFENRFRAVNSDDNNKMVMFMLRELRQVSQWSDLSYYFVALQYFLGLAEGQSFAKRDLNMMYEFACLHNPYALKAMRLIDRNVRRSTN